MQGTAPAVDVDGPAEALLLLLQELTTPDDARLRISGDRRQLELVLDGALTPQRLELDRLWLADFDLQVVWLAAQPLWLAGLHFAGRSTPAGSSWRHAWVMLRCRRPVRLVCRAVGRRRKT